MKITYCNSSSIAKGEGGRKLYVFGVGLVRRRKEEPVARGVDVAFHLTCSQAFVLLGGSRGMSP